MIDVEICVRNSQSGNIEWRVHRVCDDEEQAKIMVINLRKSRFIIDARLCHPNGKD